MNPKQQKPTLYSLYSMLNAHFYQKNIFFTQISKRSTPADLHHPDLHLAQFFSLESPKISSAYANASLGPKMEKFLQTNSNDVSNQVDIFSNDVLDITPIAVTPLWKKIFKMTAFHPKNHNPANMS